jgi:G3E family GTPase
MELRSLIPIELSDNPENGIQQLMRTFIVRANFAPAVRQVIGWRGLKHCPASIDAWTAKIQGFSGVFAWCFDVMDKQTHWLRGRYTLGYFPYPDEELVDSLALAAAAYTQRDDYFELVRNFLSYPDFASLFHVGAVLLNVSAGNDALHLGLETMTRQQTIAIEGVSLNQGECAIEAIAPGAYDQDFPSYQVAVAFFKALTASVGFCIEEAPAFLREERYPGTVFSYDSKGNFHETPSDSSDRIHVFIGYGNGNFQPEPERQDLRQLNVWKSMDEAEPSYRDPLWWSGHNLPNRNAVDKRLVGIDERPELIIVTGFLGSGKTTFLQRFIDYEISLSRFVAVIQNEIGETGLDGKLLGQDYAVVEVDEGCVCCTLAGNLKKAARQILEDFCPDYIIVETTGLANPLNILDEIAELSELVRFDSITTVVDGANILTSLDSYEVALAQIKSADILLINKTDLLAEDSLGQVIERINSINPVAPTVNIAHGDANFSLLYGPAKRSMRSCAPTGEQKDSKASRHPHVAHEHDRLSSVKIEFSEPLVRDRFLEGINMLPTQVFRIKGVIQFCGEEGPKLFQSVAGRYEISEYTNQDFEERFLICIGTDMESFVKDPQSLRSLLADNQSVVVEDR